MMELDHHHDFLSKEKENGDLTEFSSSLAENSSPAKTYFLANSAENSTLLTKSPKLGLAKSSSTLFQANNAAKKANNSSYPTTTTIGDNSSMTTTPSSSFFHSSVCWWCITSLGDAQKKVIPIIYCPIRYICRQVKSEYTPANSQNVFTIQESLSRNVKLQEENPVIEKKPYYQVVGAFCGYECCLAFICDNRTQKPIFSNSQGLLNKILFESNEKVINPDKFVLEKAPHWSTLSMFGGSTKSKNFVRSKLAFKASVVHLSPNTIFGNFF